MKIFIFYDAWNTAETATIIAPSLERAQEILKEQMSGMYGETPAYINDINESEEKYFIGYDLRV
jgi:hypothetical protein